MRVDWLVRPPIFFPDPTQTKYKQLVLKLDHLILPPTAQIIKEKDWGWKYFLIKKKFV